MIEEQAVVVQVEGDRAYLQIERNQPCGLCGTSKGCGLSLWGQVFSRRQGRLSMPNSLQLSAGDRVVIMMEEGALLVGALTAYLIPLLMVCLGGFFGAAQGVSRIESDLYGAAGAVVGLLLGLAIVRKIGSAAGKQPTMLRRAESMVVRQCSKVIT